VGQLVKEQRDSIVKHLDTFVSEDVQDKIEHARSMVSNIYGKGTTWRQTYEIGGFYSQLKSSLHESMNGHLRAQLSRFSKILINQAESIYPSIKQEISLLIDDRLHAIGSSLSELNESQKTETLKALRQVVRCCEEARKKLRASESQCEKDSSKDRLADSFIVSASG